MEWSNSNPNHLGQEIEEHGSVVGSTLDTAHEDNLEEGKDPTIDVSYNECLGETQQPADLPRKNRTQPRQDQVTCTQARATT